MVGEQYVQFDFGPLLFEVRRGSAEVWCYISTDSFASFECEKGLDSCPIDHKEKSQMDTLKTKAYLFHEPQASTITYSCTHA